LESAAGFRVGRTEVWAAGAFAAGIALTRRWLLLLLLDMRQWCGSRCCSSFKRCPEGVIALPAHDCTANKLTDFRLLEPIN
jgi:hypothetical protein